jgi:hypothetical protein
MAIPYTKGMGSVYPSSYEEERAAKQRAATRAATRSNATPPAKPMRSGTGGPESAINKKQRLAQDAEYYGETPPVNSKTARGSRVNTVGKSKAPVVRGGSVNSGKSKSSRDYTVGVKQGGVTLNQAAAYAKSKNKMAFTWNGKEYSFNKDDT